MQTRRAAWLVRWSSTAALGAALLLTSPPQARGTPLNFLPVGDPLEAELRALEILGAPDQALVAHFGMRPLQMREIGRSLVEAGNEDPLGHLSRLRLGRALSRDLPAGELPMELRGVTPRLLQREAPDDQRFELSLGLEGRGGLDRVRRRFVSGSGVHSRVGIQVGGWLAFGRLIVGHVDSARAFADPIVPGNDLIVHTEESYLSYSGESGRWSAQLGRSRWHWGPGEEASLVLSRTSAPLTGLALRVRVEPLRADAIALSATLDAAAGEQLAAHRLEWQPCGSLRIGVSEAARYRSETWQPLYLTGVIPYVLVQRLLVQDEPESSGVHRNNVVVGVDGAWRVARGTRLYFEGLIDDLRASSSGNPHKYGIQVGWEGAGSFLGGRVVWGSEYTRLTRFAYTSFFGRDFEAQRRALGFPTGPDAQRVRVRAAWDLSTDWQLHGVVARLEKGENDLDEPYVPGTPAPRPLSFEGVIEETREVELGVRFWPASGVDLSVTAGYFWVENAGHLSGSNTDGPRAALEVRLVR